VVPTPARFWLWGLALAVDLLAPLVTHRHLATVPPDGGHLPERFGLFTIILIGDSMVSVMRGMESQQDWSLDAALSAFLSMVVIFAIWWWYFDGAGAVEERALRSRAEVRRFQVWTYAHLPLYLAMLVAGVGLHHVVAIATFQRLHATEAWILCGALAVVMASVATLASAGAAHADSHRGTRARRQYGVAALMLALAGVGPFVPSSVLIGAAAVLFTLQAVVALRPTTAGARR
jgi:low temperature requirement protein LtrA